MDSANEVGAFGIGVWFGEMATEQRSLIEHWIDSSVFRLTRSSFPVLTFQTYPLAVRLLAPSFNLTTARSPRLRNGFSEWTSMALGPEKWL
jgi:hypothetical protein